MASRRLPPLLPPRSSSSTATVAPESLQTPNASVEDDDNAGRMSDIASHDARLLAEQAVQPSEFQQSRRKLLLVFIHGFMGDETSFQGFPAHLHNILTVLLEESHAVYTKIYPRYLSRRNMSFARDNFSEWLQPHDNESTDIILLGHSMGGLLATDVVLKPGEFPNVQPLKHSVLGTVNFDVPFLGLSPGVVKSGLASIFRPATSGHESDEPTAGRGSASEQESTPTANSGAESPLEPTDNMSPPAGPNSLFNPSFTNDIVLPVRKGWRNALHFVHKHRKNLPSATRRLVASHLEFGVAMAKYGELKERYAKVRMLEEDDEVCRKDIIGSSAVPARVRFVNYYTVCTGKPKRQSPSPEAVEMTDNLENIESADLRISDNTSAHGQDAQDNGIAAPQEVVADEMSQQKTVLKDARDEAVDEAIDEVQLSSSLSACETGDLLSDMRLSEHQAVETETETKGVTDRARDMQDEPIAASETIETDGAGSPGQQAVSVRTSSTTSGNGPETKPQKERTFCVLPPRDSSGQLDPCWVRVFVENVDQVGAHCGLFFVDEKYERLVGDVASRVQIWVQVALDGRLSALVGF